MKHSGAAQFLILIPILALWLTLPACSSVEVVYLPTETEGSAASESLPPTALPRTAIATQTETVPSATASLAPTDTQAAPPTLTRTPTPTDAATNTPAPTVTDPPPASLTPTAVPDEISLNWPTLSINETNIPRVGQVAVWGWGTADQVMSAGSGGLLLVRSPFGLAVYEADTQALDVFLPDVQVLAVSPDTAQIAAAYPGGVVEVRDAADLEVRFRFEHTLEVPEYPPTDYDPDQQLAVQSLAFSPRGDLLAVGYGDGVIDLHDLGDGDLEYSLTSYYTPFPSKLLFSPDLRYLFSANQGPVASSGDRINIAIWSLETGEVAGYLADVGRISDNPFRPDGKVIVTSKWGGFLIRTSIPEGVALGTIPTGLFYPSVDYGTDGHHLLVDGGSQVRSIYDGTQVRMDAETLDAIRPTPPTWQVSLTERQKWDLGHPAGLFALRFSENRDLSAWGRDDKTVYRWDLNADPQVREYPWELEPGVISVAHDQSALAACAGDRLQVMDTATESIQDWGGCQPGALDFSPVGDLVAKAHLGLVHILRLPDGDLVHNLRGHNLTPQIVRYSPDGRYLVSGNLASVRWEVFLWQTEPAAGLQQIIFDEWTLRDLAVSSDAAYLVTAGDKLRIWRASDGWQLKYLTYTVSRLAFHPDANLLAIGDDQGVIHLMVIPNGEVLGVLEGHRGSITDLRFSPDGTALVSASEDGTVRLWGIAP